MLAIRNRIKISEFFCLTVVVFWGAIANADVVFDNGLNLADADFGSVSMTSTTTGAQYQVADDFTLTAGTSWSVDGARWTGILTDSGVNQPTIGATVDFDILVFADNGGMPTGTPLDPIPGTAIASRQVTATGTDTGVFPNGADFDVSFDSIILEGGTQYWLVIAARGDFTFISDSTPGTNWLWIGRSGTGNAWQGGTNFESNWLQQGRQQDFALHGQSVPEPGGAVVLGLVGVVAFCRRRRFPLSRTRSS